MNEWRLSKTEVSSLSATYTLITYLALVTQWMSTSYRFGRTHELR
jgi:hypothetical protein